ncbi:Membrane protein implicated in regulation of membrane protease activity [Nonomuraea maritima]|jgi:membrane protein implicated in regulation of membrane protease activity|uniref:Membrane protein implicated in regulation of membrane protease activity n=1 Tax=Nonomuraea maritima TaxID=683260 RepID=A0A1G9I167_9ACTN|nr:NfeD family protein [Nonomuraea maritima]SDL18990.1 Membrane protein implicated in regulation of membrane protease activity [Nonomuraea maritima]
MDEWIIWVILAVVLGVAEIFTLTASLGLLGAAALLTAATAALGLPLPLQLIFFAASSAAGLLVLRPIAMRHVRQPPLQRFGVEALVGKPAYVVSEVSGTDGRVRIKGEEWSARAYDETLVIPAGTTVDVIEIEGATALVYPRE